MMLKKWNRDNIKTDEDRRLPITKFIESAEAMQRIRNDSSLNNLIYLIKIKKKGNCCNCICHHSSQHFILILTRC